VDTLIVLFVIIAFASEVILAAPDLALRSIDSSAM
jgi:hypothetical protein